MILLCYSLYRFLKLLFDFFLILININENRLVYEAVFFRFFEKIVCNVEKLMISPSGIESNFNYLDWFGIFIFI